MAYDGVAKVQHYVPQFLLRNFGTGKKDQLHVFNKASEKTFLSSARNVAAESRFYDFEVDGVGLTIEPALSRLETAVKPILVKLLNVDSLGALTEEDRVTLANFFAVQFVRTKAARVAADDVERQLREEMRRRGIRDEQLEEIGFAANKNTSAAMTINTIIKAPQDYGYTFMEKHWVLLGAPAKDPFVLGDHPLAMHNARPSNDIWGNIGLMVPGIEIYFPISPVRALAMWCPTIRDELRRYAIGIRALRRSNMPQSKEQENEFATILEAAHAMESGSVLHYKPENIKHFNSLQIIHAESLVFSSRDDFDFARLVVAQSDELRRGRRMRIS